MNFTTSSTPNLQKALHKHFGFTTFLEGQEDIIRQVLEGRDAVVIMPTGSGKSLCFQLPALLLEGVTLVVSPLIALMKDQVDALCARQLPATFINSSLSFGEMQARMAGIRDGQYRLVYVAPERFQDEGFSRLMQEVPVDVLAVDEAHCISQWGHDFRPDYLRLKYAVRECKPARVMALTATATPDVREDIVRQLGLGNFGRKPPVIEVFGFERPNLRIGITRASGHGVKLGVVRRLAAAHQNGIIYCATRKMTEKVTQQLKEKKLAVDMYHGGMGDEERSRVQERFMGRTVPVVVATNAFGMGIDRDDVRFVVHWDIPGSLEAYYQEIGRAGRDGADATCELLYNYADVRTQEFFIEGANPARETVLELWRVIQQQCAGTAVVCSISDWTKRLHTTRNDMAAGTALFLLSRAGLIRRDTEPGSRSYRYSLVDGMDPSAVDSILAGLDEKKQRDHRKLEVLLQYVNTSLCRHRFIMEYFGEQVNRERCEGCDNCMPAAGRELRPPTDEEWEILQKILSCTARLKGRFGKGRLIQVLQGSKAKPVLQAELDKLSTYGLLQAHPEPYLRQLIDELIRIGCIGVDRGEYPLVHLTEKGKAVMLRKQEVAMVWPQAMAPAESKTRRKASTASFDGDPRLFEALKAWRNATAKKRRVPAYLVLADKSLMAIAAARPASLADLEEVWGMGEYKIKQFGDDILGVVDQFGEVGG